MWEYVALQTIFQDVLLLALLPFMHDILVPILNSHRSPSNQLKLQVNMTWIHQHNDTAVQAQLLEPYKRDESYVTSHVRTILSTAFVFLNLVNQVMSRQLEHELNIFRGLHRAHVFNAIFVAIAVIQILINEAAYTIFGVTPMFWQEYLICVAVAVSSIPWILFFRIILKAVHKRKGPASVAPLDGKLQIEMKSVIVK
jgi:magnesium-transporting ATPase (P-type)